MLCLLYDRQRAHSEKEEFFCQGNGTTELFQTELKQQSYVVNTGRGKYFSIFIKPRNFATLSSVPCYCKIILKSLILCIYKDILKLFVWQECNAHTDLCSYICPVADWRYIFIC